jgi:hypothetical protein
VSDPIKPPAARRPQEALELVSQALSDGDLEAALAQYEGAARLVTWQQQEPSTAGEVPRAEVSSAEVSSAEVSSAEVSSAEVSSAEVSSAEVRSALTCFMALRLPLAVRIGTVLSAPGLALVICERHTKGTDPDGEQVSYRGHGCAVVRAQPDGSWRIAADAWHLGTEIPL